VLFAASHGGDVVALIEDDTGRQKVLWTTLLLSPTEAAAGSLEGADTTACVFFDGRRVNAFLPLTN
jgi:hypothetical protein